MPVCPPVHRRFFETDAMLGDSPSERRLLVYLVYGVDVARL
jgi:hypothetical protein